MQLCIPSHIGICTSVHQIHLLTDAYSLNMGRTVVTSDSTPSHFLHPSQLLSEHHLKLVSNCLQQAQSFMHSFFSHFRHSLSICWIKWPCCPSPLAFCGLTWLQGGTGSYFASGQKGGVPYMPWYLLLMIKINNTTFGGLSTPSNGDYCNQKCQITGNVFPPEQCCISNCDTCRALKTGLGHLQPSYFDFLYSSNVKGLKRKLDQPCCVQT